MSTHPLDECPFNTPSSDFHEAWHIAGESADRFRDVICQALGLEENPGDDELVFQLLRAHGKADEPESHRWRGFLDEQLARLDDEGDATS